MVIRIKISGYSDKILDFVKIYLDIMRECARPGGFDKALVKNVMDKIRTKYANDNADIAVHAANNSLLFLFPHTFHSSLM